MPTYRRPAIAAVVVLLLVSGCGKLEPTVISAAPTGMLPTAIPPTALPPMTVPATAIPPTAVPPTTMPPTTIPPTTVPPTAAPIAATADRQAIKAETVARLEKVAAFDLPDSFVNTILFSPDSTTMIAGDRNGGVLVWDCETWERSTFLPAQSTYAADEAAGVYYWGTLALSPDGTVIVNAYGDDGAVTGYDRAGQELFAFSYGARVYAVAISPDGGYLAVGGLKNNVAIFDLGTRQPAADLAGDHESIFNLVFSPDGKTLLVAYERPANVMKTWDTATWRETATFTHVTERTDYHDVLFSPDGQELAIAVAKDTTEIRFLDLATKQIVRGFPEHSRASYQMAFAPDGSLLASAGDDGTVRLWDLQTGENIKTLQPYQENMAVAFSPDGKLIAFAGAGAGIQVWAVSAAPAP